MTTLEQARQQSEMRGEIVAVEYQGRHGHRDADAAAIQGELAAGYDDEIDSAWENDGTLDIWGYSGEGGDGQMDWRLRVTITN